MGRSFPPRGETAGTIAPAERYRATQIDTQDVVLGDDSVPKLMQTDAFSPLLLKIGRAHV